MVHFKLTRVKKTHNKDAFAFKFTRLESKDLGSHPIVIWGLVSLSFNLFIHKCDHNSSLT